MKTYYIVTYQGEIPYFIVENKELAENLINSKKQKSLEDYQEYFKSAITKAQADLDIIAIAKKHPDELSPDSLDKYKYDEALLRESLEYYQKRLLEEVSIPINFSVEEIHLVETIEDLEEAEKYESLWLGRRK